MDCKNHIIGIANDIDEDGYIFIYENDTVEPDATFNYCPRCGAELNKESDDGN